MDDRLRWVEFSHELFIILHSVCERLEVMVPCIAFEGRSIVHYTIR